MSLHSRSRPSGRGADKFLTKFLPFFKFFFRKLKKLSYPQKFLMTFFSHSPLFHILPSSAQVGAKLCVQNHFLHKIFFIIKFFYFFYSHLLLYNKYFLQPRGTKLCCENGWGVMVG